MNHPWQQGMRIISFGGVAEGVWQLTKFLRVNDDVGVEHRVA